MNLPVTLEKVALAAGQVVSKRLAEEFPCVANNMQSGLEYDLLTRSIFLWFRSFVMRSSRRELSTIEYEIPATWWQMFKQEHFPAWLKRRFPVKTATRTYQYEKYARMCPHADILWPEDCRPHIEFMEGFGMETPAAIEVTQDERGLKVLHTVNTTMTVDNPVNELRSTVRLGRKWLDAEPGERVELTVGTSHEERVPFGEAVIESIEYLPFELLTDRHIQTNHNMLSRTRTSLGDAMRRAYGDRFRPSSPVTVLFYRRVN